MQDKNSQSIHATSDNFVYVILSVLVDFRLRHLVCQRGTAPTSHTCWTTKHLRLATILDSVIARVVTLERLYSKAFELLASSEKWLAFELLFNSQSRKINLMQI